MTTSHGRLPTRTITGRTRTGCLSSITSQPTHKREPPIRMVGGFALPERAPASVTKKAVTCARNQDGGRTSQQRPEVRPPALARKACALSHLHAIIVL